MQAHPSETSLVDGPPSWTLRFVGGRPAEAESDSGGVLVSTIDGEHGRLVSARVPRATELGTEAFLEATVAAYAAIERALSQRPGLNPVRMWNFIPGILEPLGRFPQRYMAFNAGRFEAFGKWRGRTDDFPGWVPTSSGVGNVGPDLVVHALACDASGVPIENERQVSSYRYSQRYGPRPPCFARGFRLATNGPRSALLLIGGTASVVGERTLHAGNLDAQIDETLENLDALIRKGLPEIAGDDRRDVLGSIRQTVVYYVRERDRDAVERAVRTRFAEARETEFLRTELCREGLLVEIEGVASIEPDAASARA